MNSSDCGVELYISFGKEVLILPVNMILYIPKNQENNLILYDLI